MRRSAGSRNQIFQELDIISRWKNPKNLICFFFRWNRFNLCLEIPYFERKTGRQTEFESFMKFTILPCRVCTVYCVYCVLHTVYTVYFIILYHTHCCVCILCSRVCQLGVEEFSGFNLLDIDEEREREMIYQKRMEITLYFPRMILAKLLLFSIFKFSINRVHVAVWPAPLKSTISWFQWRRRYGWTANLFMTKVEMNGITQQCKEKVKGLLLISVPMFFVCLNSRKKEKFSDDKQQ